MNSQPVKRSEHRGTCSYILTPVMNMAVDFNVVWLLCWLNFYWKERLAFNQSSFISRRALYSEKKTSTANPNVSRFVFWITKFIITVLLKFVPTQVFSQLLLTGHRAKFPSWSLCRYFENFIFWQSWLNHGFGTLSCSITSFEKSLCQ